MFFLFLCLSFSSYGVCLTVWVWVSLLCLTVCVSDSVSESVCVWLCLSVSYCLCLYCVCDCLSVCVLVSLFVRDLECLSVFLSLCLSVLLCVSLSVSFSVCFRVSGPRKTSPCQSWTTTGKINGFRPFFWPERKKTFSQNKKRVLRRIVYEKMNSGESKRNIGILLKAIPLSFLN